MEIVISYRVLCAGFAKSEGMPEILTSDQSAQMTILDVETGWPDSVSTEESRLAGHDVIVIGPDEKRPHALADSLQHYNPTAQIVFFLQKEKLERFRAMLPYIPHLSQAWTASASDPPEHAQAVVFAAAQAARQQETLAILRDRINARVSLDLFAGEAQRRERHIRLSERFMTTVFQQAPDSILAVDLNGQILSLNDAAARVFGTANNAESQESIFALFNPSARDDAEGIFDRAKLGETIAQHEIPMAAHDGSLFHSCVSLAPIRDESDTIVGIAMIMRDITERKRFEQRREILVAELNHRVKNTLAVVLSLVVQTRSTAAAPDDFYRALVARIQALARAHDLLTHHDWEGADLEQLIRNSVAPYSEDCCSFSGPKVRLTPAAAVTLTLVFHELATNAAKYGALSIPGGRVSVTWTATAQQIELIWCERNGPPVGPRMRLGFGSRLIERIISHELDGKGELDFVPKGLLCRIMFSPAEKASIAA